jgi:blocked-early-in-transport protein 1
MDMEGSTGLLSGTMKRVDHMIGAGKGNRKLMCYIIIALITAFLIFYFILSRFSGS